MSPSTYEPLTALLGSDATNLGQAPSNQTRTSSRIENRNLASQQQEDEEPITGYTYNPSERIERMFGISPPWR